MRDVRPAAEVHERGLALHVPGQGEPVYLSWTWLRDHCHSPHSLAPDTGQKVHTPLEILDQSPAKEIHYDEDKNLYLTWLEDNRKSYYPRHFLEAYQTPMDSGNDLYAHPVKWTNSDCPKRLQDGVDVADFLSDDAVAYRESMMDLARYGFAILRNVPKSTSDTEAIANRIAFIAKTFYGEMGVIESKSDSHADSAWTMEELGPHTDGTYMETAPGLQALHCLELDCTGGESMLVDGFKVAERLTLEAPDYYELLSRVEIPYRYVDATRHYETKNRVLRHDGARLVQVQYNCYDRGPFLPECSCDHFYRALACFHRLASDPDLTWEFQLREGDALIFDNWRLLHGRRAFQGRKRRLASFYIDRDAYRSAVRVATQLEIV